MFLRRAVRKFTNYESTRGEDILKIGRKTIRNVLVVGLGPMNAAYVIPRLVKKKLAVSLWSEYYQHPMVRLRIKSERSYQCHDVKVVNSLNKLFEKPDLVIWGNKKNTNNERIAAFKKVFSNSNIPHLILQNGIESEVAFEALGTNISRGVLYVGAKKELDPDGTYYCITGDRGMLVGASRKSSRENSFAVVKFLQNLEFNAKFSYDIFVEEIRKTGHNINNYVVIFGKCLFFGEIDKTENSHLRKIRDKAIEEYYEIYKNELLGFGISCDLFREEVCNISKQFATHIPTHAAKLKTLNLEDGEVQEMEDLLSRVIEDGEKRGCPVKNLSQINQAYLDHQYAVKQRLEQSKREIRDNKHFIEEKSFIRSHL